MFLPSFEIAKYEWFISCLYSAQKKFSEYYCVKMFITPLRTLVVNVSYTLIVWLRYRYLHFSPSLNNVMSGLDLHRLFS